MNHFGKVLKRYRQDKEMTQHEVAQKTGLSDSGIAKLEQGDRSPMWQTVRQLEMGLGLETGYFGKWVDMQSMEEE